LHALLRRIARKRTLVAAVNSFTAADNITSLRNVDE
jgi:hypothetical protein